MANEPDFRGFMRAVGKHWVALMSGGLITVALGLFERFSGKSVPLWAYAAVIVFFAFLACYLAWKDTLVKAEVRIAELTDKVTRLTPAVPDIDVQINEAIISPMSPTGAKCFLRVTLKNLTEKAPCMIVACNLGLRINDAWFRGTAIPLNADDFQLVGHVAIASVNDLAPGEAYTYEDGELMAEIAHENIADMTSVVNETSPLRWGFPRSAWVGFARFCLPAWPATVESDTDHEGETATKTSYTTDSLQEVEIEILDGHGERHVGRKTRPFGPEWRRIKRRQSPLASVSSDS